jgi:hypothetical protein
MHAKTTAVSRAKSTHYLVSTIAALLYAAACLLANRAQAAVADAQPEATKLEEVVIWGVRPASPQQELEEVVIYGVRAKKDSSRVAAASSRPIAQNANLASDSAMHKAIRWVRTTLRNWW